MATAVKSVAVETGSAAALELVVRFITRLPGNNLVICVLRRWLQVGNGMYGVVPSQNALNCFIHTQNGHISLFFTNLIELP